jgi:hypothetical protein
VNPEVAQAFRNKALVISKLNPKDPRILTAPNEDHLNFVLTKTRQWADAVKTDQPPVDLERNKEALKYALIFAAWKGAVTETLEKAEKE